MCVYVRSELLVCLSAELRKIMICDLSTNVVIVIIDLLDKVFESGGY